MNDLTPWWVIFRSSNELEEYLSLLQQAIEKYRKYPADSRAFLPAKDFENLFKLLARLTDRTKEADERSLRAIKKADDTLDGITANTKSIGYLTERIVVLERENKHFRERIEAIYSTIDYLERTPAVGRALKNRDKEKEKYCLDAAPLSVRAFNCMKNEFGKDVSALTVSNQTRDQLLRIPNLGRRSLKEIEEGWLKPLGLKLAGQ